jgi:hypothetical protein
MGQLANFDELFVGHPSDIEDEIIDGIVTLEDLFKVVT